MTNNDNDNDNTNDNTPVHNDSKKKQRRKKRRGDGGGCYHCGSLTHRGKACPEAICRHCGEAGHDVGGCPRYQKQQQGLQRDTANSTTTTTTVTARHNDVPSNPNAMHFKMYKPVNVLSQFVFPCKRQKGKRLLGDFYNFPSGTMAIGRLDADSEGLLLLTRDGKTSSKYTSTKISKEYHVEVDGIVTQEAIDTMCQGVEIKTIIIGQGRSKIGGCDSSNSQKETYKTLPCEARILMPSEEACHSYHSVDNTVDQKEESNNQHDDKEDNDRYPYQCHDRLPRRHRPTSWISITIKEGKFRQVRKMTAAIGYPTLRLIRVRIGTIHLDGLAVGQVAELESL